MRPSVHSRHLGQPGRLGLDLGRKGLPEGGLNDGHADLHPHLAGIAENFDDSAGRPLPFRAVINDFRHHRHAVTGRELIAPADQQRIGQAVIVGGHLAAGSRWR